MDDNMSEEVYQSVHQYVRGQRQPPELIADSDQTLAKMLDAVREGKQMILLIAKEATEDGMEIDCFTTTHGNSIEIANFLHLTHTLYHQRLESLINDLPTDVILYMISLRQGGQMLSPMPEDTDES